MKLLIAPLHYLANPEDGSEYTRAYENCLEIVKEKDWSGDILVGYMKEDRIGKFKIHKFFKSKPTYITTLTRIKFVFWVFFTYLKLSKETKYDCIWHQGPFAIDETFSLVALHNHKRVRFVLGPIYTPHIAIKESDFGDVNKKSDGTIVKLSWTQIMDRIFYSKFAKIFPSISRATLKQVSQVITIDGIGKSMLKERAIENVMVDTITIKSTKFDHPVRSLPVITINLLNVSYQIERKRTIDIIEALGILINNRGMTNLFLTIVGDGPQLPLLKSKAVELGIEKQVKFIGHVSRLRVAKYYRNSDIFVSASISDIMPGMYFEAMNSSLPMVIAKNITSEELRRNGFGGYVVDGYSPKSIADSIHKIITIKSQYQNFSEKNYELSHTIYDYNSSIDKLKNLLLKNQ